VPRKAACLLVRLRVRSPSFLGTALPTPVVAVYHVSGIASRGGAHLIVAVYEVAVLATFAAWPAFEKTKKQNSIRVDSR